MIVLSPLHGECLKSLYINVPEALNRIPYSHSSDSIYSRFCLPTGLEVTKADLWYALASLRKRSQLPIRVECNPILQTSLLAPRESA